MKLSNEMQRLRDYLDDQGIRWQDASDARMNRTYFSVRGNAFSAIEEGKDRLSLLINWLCPEKHEMTVEMIARKIAEVKTRRLWDD